MPKHVGAHVLGIIFSKIFLLCAVFFKRTNKILKINLGIAKCNTDKKDVLNHSGYMIGTFASLPYILKDWKFNLIGEENLKNTKGPAIIFSAHIGQIWLGAVAAHLCKEEFYHSYRTLPFEGLQEIFETIYKDSSKYFLGSISENNAKGFITALRSGKKLIILADQHNNGVEVPFFGQNAKFGTGAAKLAVKFNCPLIPVHGFLSGKKSYTIIIEKPIEIDFLSETSSEKVSYLTKQIAAKIETWIKEHPSQYWWLIKRWPRRFYD